MDSAPKFKWTNKDLAAIYRSDNLNYFNNKLPESTTFSFELVDPVADMAETTYPVNGGFNIAIGPQWMESNITRRLLMLHEECHVYVDSKYPNTPGVHNREWRTCMLMLDIKNAFRDILIFDLEDK